MLKRIIDTGMVVVLLCLMSYQVTGRALHEWIGIVMTVLVITHIILNRKWYSTIFKGKYNAYRIVTTIVNAMLMTAFLVTAFCGMAMSGNAVPFMHGIIPVSIARMVHLSVNQWTFVLMGIHLGMHIPVITADMKISGKARTVITAVFCGIAGAGLFFFIRNGLFGHMFFQVMFAFFEYEKPGLVVFMENIVMLIFWAFLGCQCAAAFRKQRDADTEKKVNLRPVVFMVAAVVIGLVIKGVWLY